MRKEEEGGDEEEEDFSRLEAVPPIVIFDPQWKGFAAREKHRISFFLAAERRGRQTKLFERGKEERRRQKERQKKKKNSEFD